LTEALEIFRRIPGHGEQLMLWALMSESQEIICGREIGQRPMTAQIIDGFKTSDKDAVL